MSWRSRLRPWAIRLFGYGALLGVSLLVAFIIAEITVRLAMPQQLIQIRPDLWQPVDTLGWRRLPSANVAINTGERAVTVMSDSESFRIGKAGRKEAPTSVLLIGDSFVEALQVEYEQSTAHLLEEELSRTLGKPVVVRSDGVAGWSPNHYLIETRRQLARARYALVVVAVFVGNDAVPRRIDEFPRRAYVERKHFRLPRALSWSEFVNAFLGPINDGLETRSHFFILLKNQLANVRMKLGITADYFPVEYRRDEATSARWGVTAGLLRDIDRAAKARGVPTLFVLIPERFQVYADEFDRYITGFGIDSATVDVEQPTRLLRTAMQAESLRVIDALPQFREAMKTRPRLFGRVDQHLSPEGHVVLAAVVAPEAARLLKR